MKSDGDRKLARFVRTRFFTVRVASVGSVERPPALLLLPWKLEGSLLQEQAEDLVSRGYAIVVEPGMVPFSSLGKLPRRAADLLSSIGARGLRLPYPPRVIVLFHPWQVPLARAIQRRFPGSQLWFSRWDRYEAAFRDGYYENAKLGRRLEALQREVGEVASLTIAASRELEAIERAAGREVALVPPSADRFPAPEPSTVIIGVSLGHLGKRTDWPLLYTICTRLPNLVVLLIGSWSEREVGADPAFRACRTLPNLVWLGFRPDEEAARLILCADVGLVLFKRDLYNEAGIPNRILKYARLGRYSICPDFAGSRTWDRALRVANEPDAWVAALAGSAGARVSPDEDLRVWALSQTAELHNRPLRERLDEMRHG